MQSVNSQHFHFTAETAGWKANRVDPDQMMHYAVCGLGVHCLHSSVYPSTHDKYRTQRIACDQKAKAFPKSISWVSVCRQEVIFLASETF